MLEKIFRVSVNILMGLLIVLGLSVAFSSIPIPGNYKVFTVQSGSMEPTIKTGALIFTKPSEVYQVGDVITRRTLDPKVTITHRIVEEKEVQGNKVFMTQGDANSGEDKETVSPESIVGKVVFDIPYLGYPVSYARTQQGFILLVIIPAVLLIYEELRKISYEIQKKMRFKKVAKQNGGQGMGAFFRKKEGVKGVVKNGKS